MSVNVRLVAIVVALASVAPASAGAQIIMGGGETIVTGGSGGTGPVPVITRFGFRIVKDGDNVSGTFDCLALAPSAPTGPGSGAFTENIMYVTGKITSVSDLTKNSATFQGTANVTGLGAGVNLPFNCVVENTGEVATAVRPSGTGITAGGAGAHMTLDVSGLTFDEILTSGGISVLPLKKAKGRR